MELSSKHTQNPLFLWSVTHLSTLCVPRQPGQESSLLISLLDNVVAICSHQRDNLEVKVELQIYIIIFKHCVSSEIEEDNEERKKSIGPRIKIRRSGLRDRRSTKMKKNLEEHVKVKKRASSRLTLNSQTKRTNMNSKI